MTDYPESGVPVDHLSRVRWVVMILPLAAKLVNKQCSTTCLVKGFQVARTRSHCVGIQDTMSS